MKIFNRIALGAMGVVLVTSPLSGAVILTGLERGFQLIFQYGSPINLIASVIVAVWLMWQLWTSREQVKTAPKKSAKQNYKEQKYIATN